MVATQRILLIGRNPTLLANLAEALTAEGFAVNITNLVEQASQDFSGADFDLIAFGRGVDEETNAHLRTIFSVQNPKLIFVNGLAPVIPLLVKQIKLALADKPLPEKTLTDFRLEKTDSLRLHITTAVPCQLTIDLYQLDAVHITRQTTLVSEAVSAGVHTFPVDKLPDASATINFLVAEVANLDMVVLPL